MPAPSIISIGNFDGVHLGHRAILSAARELADAGPDGCRVLALTFDPPPVAVLFPDRETVIPPQLSSLAGRIEQLRAAGADEVVVLRPDKALLGLSAEAFIDKLIADYAAAGFAEGEDFRFGKGRGGDMARLQAMGKDRGFAVRAMPRLEAKLSDHSLAPISSSLVRWLVGRGRVEDAEACLGRSFSLSGSIVKGDQRGRTIGIPTANLNAKVFEGMAVPMDGVYAGRVTISAGTFASAISVGDKPTFAGRQLTIEAHLLGYTPGSPPPGSATSSGQDLSVAEQGNELYGQPATFHFARWLRDQYPFPSVDKLVQQLHRDIEAARLKADPQPNTVM